MELLTDKAIEDKTAPISSDADNLVAQTERMEIKNDEDLGKAGDLVKLITNRKKKSEEARTALVKPLNDHVKFINDQFRPVNTKLDDAKRNAQGKMNEYVQWVEKQRKEREAEERRAAEEKALEAAAQAEAEGETEKSDEIIDNVVNLPERRSEPVRQYGNLSTTSNRKTWKVEVLDITKIPLQYLVNMCDGEQSIVDAPLAILALDRKKIKEELKQLKAGVEEYQIPGLKVYKALSVGVR